MLFVFGTEPDSVQPKLSQLLIDQDMVVDRMMVDRSTAASREGSLLTLGLGHHLSHPKHSPILIRVVSAEKLLAFGDGVYSVWHLLKWFQAKCLEA